MPNINTSIRTYRSIPRGEFSREDKRSLVQQLLAGDCSSTLAQLAPSHDYSVLGKAKLNDLNREVDLRKRVSILLYSNRPDLPMKNR